MPDIQQIFSKPYLSAKDLDLDHYLDLDLDLDHDHDLDLQEKNLLSSPCSSDLRQIFRKPYLSDKDHNLHLHLDFDLDHGLGLDLDPWRITCPEPSACLIFTNLIFNQFSANII